MEASPWKYTARTLPPPEQQGSAPRRQLLVALAAQTGDQGHVAGAGAVDDKTDILIIFSSDKTATKADRDAALAFHLRATDDKPGHRRVFFICFKTHKSARKFYVNIADSGNYDRIDFSFWPQLVGRKKTLKNNSVLANLQLEEAGYVARTFEQMITYTDPGTTGPLRYYNTLAVLHATDIVAEAFDAYEKPEERIGMYTFLTDRIASIADSKSILLQPDWNQYLFPNGNRRVLLVWGRYTGNNTPDGYNPEGDSDLIGQRQLLDMAAALDFDVITVGHDPKNVPPEQFVHAPCHIGEFYRQPSVGPSRSRQLSFMMALMSKYRGNLYQIGQKTGGMDAGAMAGMPTLYIEDQGSPTKTRMETWTTRVPFYRCGLVTEAPTLLGRALRQLWKDCPGLMEKAATDTATCRRWAVYCYLLELTSGNVPDYEGLKNQIDPLPDSVGYDAQALATAAPGLDAQIATMTAALNPPQCRLRGYNDYDLALIQSTLVGLVEQYRQNTTIVRDTDGTYKARSALH